MEKLIAKHLLEIEAVFLRPNQPFTWASGIKSPIYCDNRLTLSSVNVRKDIIKGLANIIKNEYPETEVIMGTATAGIAHAALVADYLDLPMGYVRGGNKAHGRNNKIEGKLLPGQKVVVIEDLISTAGSSLEVVNTLKESGADVLGIASIFTYDLQKGLDRLEKSNVKNVSISNLDVLVAVAAEENYISESDIEKILKFRSNPSDSSWMDI